MFTPTDLVAFQHRRAAFLIALGRMHYHLTRTAVALFDGDEERTHAFLRNVAIELPFPPDSREFVFFDALAELTTTEDITIETDIETVLWLLSSAYTAKG